MQRQNLLNRPVALAAALLLGLACATTPVAPATSPLTPDAAQAEGTVTIVTVDADGAERETPIWILGLDGAIYIRTTNSRWHANIQRDPVVRLQVAGSEYALRAENVADAALRQRIVDAFRAKYGFTDAFIGMFRGSGVNILRLAPK